MDKYDAITWKYLVPGNASNVSHSALSLVNYPWNKIISSALIHDHNIFFGTTAVQNDVQFHWHAISRQVSSLMLSGPIRHMPHPLPIFSRLVLTYHPISFLTIG